MVTTTNSTYRRYPVGGASYQASYFFQDSIASPRVNGKLQLRANPWSMVKVTTRAVNRKDANAPVLYPDFGSYESDEKVQRARSVAESDLRLELARRMKDRNSGALGVSLASGKQSLDMLRGSSNSLVKLFEVVDRFYLSTKGKKRGKRLRRLVNRGGEPVAGKVLEGFFGWAPLLDDLVSACRTLSDPWPPRTHYAVRKGFWVESGFDVLIDRTRHTSMWSASGHSTYSCTVAVSNPNLWVANKLGLINPGSVAWDLVPWSFLVNMVSSVGQIIGSLTDFVGLSLSNTSMTRSTHVVEKVSKIYTGFAPKFPTASASGTRAELTKGRLIDQEPPPVALTFRAPDWSIGTALISSALLTQQIGRLQRHWTSGPN